jgi:NADH-quinone oxidoreductase subunit J
LKKGRTDNRRLALDKLGYVYFGIAALLALFGAITAVSTPNPIRGAMGLLVMILSIAGLYLALNAQFLAAVQVIVYAGAIVVLFVFVIMLLGPSAVSSRDNRGRFPRYAGSALFLGIGTSALWLLFRAMPTPKPIAPPANLEFGTIEAFGTELFTMGIIPFELASSLLLVAIVGAVAVARGKHGELAEKTMAKTGHAPHPNHGGTAVTTESRR